ncbi:uncharacterized protein LOC131203152 [Ahaetulla prasina]|uniref:uncharacterized protein LOC131203152 n=1 Tax=Ahaetulla prasina TaxID=499056 RepID=UPI00264856B6|nr:uncharacterized protein LOC131203152 [Ahaetulla prasina]
MLLYVTDLPVAGSYRVSRGNIKYLLLRYKGGFGDSDNVACYFFFKSHFCFFFKKTWRKIGKHICQINCETEEVCLHLDTEMAIQVHLDFVTARRIRKAIPHLNTMQILIAIKYLRSGSPIPGSWTNTGPRKQVKPHLQHAGSMQNQVLSSLQKNLSPWNWFMGPKRLGAAALDALQVQDKSRYAAKEDRKESALKSDVLQTAQNM